MQLLRGPAPPRFQGALSDFQLALAQLRGNTVIDYTQLGLRFRLQAWEVSGHRVVWGVAAQAAILGSAGAVCGPGLLWVVLLS